MNSAEVASWVADARAAFASAKNLDELKLAKIAHLGDKAPISLASRSLGSVPAEQKAELGKIVGSAKSEINSEFEKRTSILEIERGNKVLLEEVVDVTLPARTMHRGGLHPITVIKNEISDYFLSMGYSIAE